MGKHRKFPLYGIAMTNEATEMKDTTINRQLYEAMGKCWHEAPEIWYRTFICKKCSAPFLGLMDLERPSYTSSLDAAFSLVEWMRKEKGWHFQCEADLSAWDVVIFCAAGVHPRATDKSLPKAIALAAHRALGLEEVGVNFGG